MIIRKQLHLAQRGLVCALAFAGLAGCSSIGSLLEPDRIDYKSAGKAPSLEIPPDLTQLERENRYAIPEANRGTATASGYNMQQTARPAATTSVSPAATPDMRIERAGNQRWLVVQQSPEVLWPQIKDFWQDSGFLINLEAPQAGLMETDWAENRAKIPQDFIRNTIGKALDALYSTGERDKFRTRLERSPNGATEIYISHRGAQEVLVGQEKESTVWTPRPADPELEAEFLARLMARLGTDGTRAKAVVANAGAQPVRAKLVNGNGPGYVEVDEGFDRAWRRVGLALDRVGFTVEDRDRAQGLYFVRYVDQADDATRRASEKGFFSKLFSFGGDDKAKAAQRYQVAVKGNGGVTQVAVLNNEGRPESSQTANRILSLLNEQLK
ncbi:MAG TPA: outer membrane protein assembly factor BamC [Noviherbaspirillum sp.]|jgi:outer membrane protein assembly factor BamC|uniref:outer membrane protein assembly factor BamC n=1 Tax=Noviherbaspirillum sp. TaxID=1926288 RepID=UPI002DDD3169|nr:outer membrane protein assembly factor BamC [Noviherbaspirillum sp.]HEV2612769.1 outer membrane protein assembly factor BamC [Noviherbaspirillum sp.]